METKRLALRRFQLSDLANMIELESNPEIMKFAPARLPLSPEQIAKRLQDQVDKEKSRAPLGVWAAEMKNSKDFVGWLMLTKAKYEFPELGFMLVQRHWGKGLATEAAACLVDFGFQTLKLPAISAATDQSNLASKRVLLKLGFIHQKTAMVPDRILSQEVPLDIFELRRSVS